jgi:hypothetical protein
MIVVGAPVFERGWILQRWFDGLAQQDLELMVVLNYGPGTDDTLAIIERNRERFPIHVVQTPGVEHVAERQWNLPRYVVMTTLRNDLLRVVRQLSPDYFLSCDTDMLMPPGALQTLIETIEPYDGIAPLTFMTHQDCEHPNWLTADLQRPAVPHGITEQYAVFGTVLMNRALYAVDYGPHNWGEDLGWAANVRTQGLRLAMNADVKVKHVMFREALDVFDDRVGMA